MANRARALEADRRILEQTARLTEVEKNSCARSRRLPARSVPGILERAKDWLIRPELKMSFKVVVEKEAEEDMKGAVQLTSCRERD